ncbi:hypothetical protein [Vallitalea guaymasensis]|uniref:Uncharacterized protein n=1 Tax=Vallitalea guaymasensis TaxID=1185412 RepID=A0A8J8MDM9_9FIRM|nr:hypothetical protein [Vallitalea guaymasensis]QUH31124.1 hypothetical protein HYG85_20245 [Vallitalea guaymasensis]
MENEEISCQLKDFSEISIKDIKIVEDQVIIKGKSHDISSNKNIIFVKHLDLQYNSKILGFKAYQMKNVYIIGLSRVEIYEIIEEMYQHCISRIPRLEKIFERKLDIRHLKLTRKDLPYIEVYSTELLDQTVNLGNIKLGHNKIIQIEGKPGVGKSHLVNHIEIDDYDIIYRFWISNQDTDYRNRLEFNNFLFDLSKSLFNDLVFRSMDKIISKLDETSRLLIIDGLDHVENYNYEQLNLFINFLNHNWENAKIIIFTRPLRIETGWKKICLSNWNFNQVEIYLDKMLMISDYTVVMQIYKISKGYPIIVNYLGKHYSKFKSIPKLETINDLNEYYDQLTRRVRVKSALTIFLCTKSYLMISEIKLLLSDPLLCETINEFLNDYPYLFEVRLNRVSLIHDSFNTFIRESIPQYSSLLEPIYNKVYESLIKEESRFQSRFGLFELLPEQKLYIIKKYANIDCFNNALKKCIDFEALRNFYLEIRNEIYRIPPNALTLEEYYDIGLILNIVSRDHFSTLNGFLYTYVQALIFNGYTIEDITSSEFLFGMFYYIEENNIDVLLRMTSDNNYSIDDYYTNFLNDIKVEKLFFKHLECQMTMNNSMRAFLSKEGNYHEYLIELLVNIYINGTDISEIKELEGAIRSFIDDKDVCSAEKRIETFMTKHKMNTTFIRHTLIQVSNKLNALGIINVKNKYIDKSLAALIEIYKNEGSFDLREHILNYLRLSIFQSRKIDIESISSYFAMYYMRKDYTVVNVDTALIVFEKCGFISPEVSLEIIIDVQNLSEKGIRHILHNYVNSCDTSIIKRMRRKYDLKDLNVRWLELPVTHIEMLGRQEFVNLLYHEMERRYIYSYIEYDDIENVLNSKYKNLALDYIKWSGKSLRFNSKNAKTKIISEYGINVEYHNEEESYTSKSHKKKLLEGILTDDAAYLIKDNNLSLDEVASCNDGNYCTLAELNLFKEFESKVVTQDMQSILHKALNGKIKSIDMYCNLYYFVGNMLKLLDKYDCNVDWNKLYNSFMTYIEISLLRKYE